MIPIILAASSVPFKLNFIGLVKQMMSALSPVLAVVGGGFIAFLLIRRGLKWLGLFERPSDVYSSGPDPDWLHADSGSDFSSLSSSDAPPSIRRLDHEISRLQEQLDSENEEISSAGPLTRESMRRRSRFENKIEDLIFERNLQAEEVLEKIREREKKEFDRLQRESAAKKNNSTFLDLF